MLVDLDPNQVSTQVVQQFRMICMKLSISSDYDAKDAMRVHQLDSTQTELFRPEVYGNHERLFLGCFDVLALKCSSDCASSVAGAIMHKSDRDQKSCQEIHA